MFSAYEHGLVNHLLSVTEPFNEVDFTSFSRDHCFLLGSVLGDVVFITAPYWQR